MDIVSLAIGIVMPNVKDMELIQKYGLLNWSYVFGIKLLVIVIVIWFIFDFLGIEIKVGRKRS